MPDVVDYSSKPPPRARTNWIAVVCFFAILSAACALMKSRQYHEHGQLAEERIETALFIGVSAICVIITLALLPRYVRTCRSPLAPMILLAICVFVIALITMSVMSLRTATHGSVPF